MEEMLNRPIVRPVPPSGLETEFPHEKTSQDKRKIGEITYRFSGHQTFPLRIAWIPKAVAEIVQGRDPLTNIDEGISVLGLGKNMVEALRCWIEAFQVATKAESQWKLTAIGEKIFHPNKGLDPYLDDTATSWLLHWLICTSIKAPFFAWECLFNRWPSAEFSATSVLDSFRKESDSTPRPVSSVTLKQHWEVFLHSYRPHRGNAEEHLDCVLSILGLFRESGERINASGRVETVYSFDTGRRSSIPQQLFAFTIHNWWNSAFPHEQTVLLRDLVAGDHSPGRIFRMTENEVLNRIDDLARHGKMFEIVESANLRQLRRSKYADGVAELTSAYQSPRFI